MTVECIFVVFTCNIRKTLNKADKPQGGSAAVRKRDEEDDAPDEVVLGKRQKLETVSAEEIK